ncbi:hypothetical protein F5883DRAFT_586356, partial [Diaporthe sp. PMI_573]
MIYCHLWPGPLVRNVYLSRFGPEERVSGCCDWCASWTRWLPSINGYPRQRICPWSPSVLLRLSTAHRAHWLPVYRSTTRHLICPGQLEAYWDIFLNRQMARDRADDGLPLPRALSAHVVLTKLSVAYRSLDVIFEARRLFQFSYHVPAHGWAGGEATAKRCEDLVRRLDCWYHETKNDGSALLPRSGTMARRLFLGDELDLWLHLDPGYLASSPALDLDMRDALHQLWCEARTGIHLLILPRDNSEMKSYVPLDGDQWTKNFERLWTHRPNHIVSLRFSKERIGCMRQSDTGSRYIVQALPYVLPGGLSLLPLDLGVDEPRLRRTTTAAVYLQIAQKDKEFRIQPESPGETTAASGGEGESKDGLPDLAHLSLEPQGGDEWMIMEDVI